MTDADLVRLLLVLADALEPTQSAGLVRLAAQRLATAEPTPAPDACPVCGGAVEQPATGRRRRYCSTRCKRRASKRDRNARVES